MQEKLSVAKVYRNAYRYVASHLFAFAFLTIFYFLGSLLPIFVGLTFFKILFPICLYLFFYFATGCYYKQKLLWDKSIFIATGMRFLTACAIFLLALVISSVLINFGIYFIMATFPNTGNFFGLLFASPIWLVGKYVFMFLLFVTFFIIPSFAFVSEVTGQDRSLLITYVKTKGNILRIATVVAVSLIFLCVMMFLLTYVSIVTASLVRAMVLVFICIMYFKMYDFFYRIPNTLILYKNENKVKKERKTKNVDEKGVDDVN